VFSEPGDVAPTDVAWTPFPMTPVDSSSKGTYYTRVHLKDTADNNQNSYWLTATSNDEYVVFDFGRRRTFNHLILTVYSHDDTHNVRGYRFEVSDDGREWTTIKEGNNPDAAGAAYPYELDRPRTGRYLRFTAVDNFGGQGFVISDVKAGMLSTSPPHRDDPPTPPTRPAQPHAPAVRLPVALPPRRPALSVTGPARLTSKRRLRVPVRCSGLRRRVVARVSIRASRRGRAAGPRLARARVRVAPGCRVLRIPLKSSVARRVRRGKLTRVSLSVRLPGGRTQSLRVRIVR
jgi:hypothetical protein